MKRRKILRVSEFICCKKRMVVIKIEGRSAHVMSQEEYYNFLKTIE